MPALSRAGRALSRWLAQADAQRQRCVRFCINGIRWVQLVRRTREQLGQEALQSRGRAERKALSLLLDLLSPEQRDDFKAHGFFHVTGAATGERYRLRVDSVVNIDVLCHDGTVRYHLCARPAGNIPVYDVMAGQLLHLQDGGAEQRFLDQAKRHPTLLFPALAQCR